MCADTPFIHDGEHLEPLGGGISVIVSKENRFSTDTVLLADFSQPKKHERAIEFGAGCGAISLIWCRNISPRSVTSIEIQQEAADMMTRSVKLNALEEKVNVINTDIKSLKGVIPFGKFDLCAMNPPYKIGGGGIVNSDDAKRIARHETKCTLDDITKAASQVLRFGGRFCICQRPERLADVIMSMRGAGIEPKRLRLVQQRAGKAPKFFLLEGRRGGSSGGLVVMPTLFIEDESGNFSQEMIDIYGDYKEGYI